jgi:hypothetical protein
MNTQTTIDRTTTPRTATLGARWQLLGALLAVAFIAAGGTDSHLIAVLVILAALAALGETVIGRPWGAWVVAAAGTAGVAIGMLTAVDAIALLFTMAAALAVLGLVRGARVDRRALGIRSAAFVGFSAIALTAMMIDPVPGALLAALLAIGRGSWDLAGARRQAAVTDAFAEFAGVLCMGAGLALFAVWVRVVFGG